LLKIIRGRSNEEVTRTLKSIFLAMKENEVILESVSDILWRDFPLPGLLERIQKKSTDGLLILFNILLTCTYYISNINSNKTTTD
jgi:hypothetical protein